MKKLNYYPNFIWQYRWRKELNSQRIFKEHNPKLKLRLILGPGRSGTSWLSQVLAKSSTPLRFFNEPLSHFKPPLQFSRRPDFLAASFKQKITSKHPLYLAYSILTSKNNPALKVLKGDLTKKNPKDDLSPQIVLIKEVHSLLLTEALLQALPQKTILITRNPISAVDSNLANQGLDSPVWLNEFQYIQNKKFLKRYFPDSWPAILKRLKKISRLSSRSLPIFAKIFTVAVINGMLVSLAQQQKNVRHVRYEDLCSNPNQLFSAAASFLGLKTGSQFEKFLQESQASSSPNPNPYSVFRNSAAQLNKPLKIISPKEVQKIKTWLLASGLGE